MILVFQIMQAVMAAALALLILYAAYLLAAFACGRINGKRLSAMRKYVWMVSLFFSLFSILMFILKGSY